MIAVNTLVTQIMAIGTGVAAIIGAVLAAAKWRREDTGLMVNQATALVTGMNTIADELRRERDEARKERDEQRTENLELRDEVKALRAECACLRQEVTKLRGVMERYQEKGGES